MVLSLVSIFSIGIFQSVMELKDKPAAAGYTFTSASEISKDTYNNNSVFYINSPEGFKGFVITSQVNNVWGDIVYDWSGKTIYLTADIDMGNWSTKPIGAAKSVTNHYYSHFEGVFDGQFHTLSNLNITSPVDDGDPVYSGIFARIGKGSVGNIRFRNCIITNDGKKTSEPLYMGIVAGTISVSSSIVNCVIEDCTIRNSVEVKNLYTSPTAGGCIDIFDQANHFSNITGSYTWNTQMTLSIGVLGRIVVRNFYNNDSNGCKLGPDYVKFYLSWVTLGSSYVSLEASFLNMYECIIGDNVAGGGHVCGVSKEYSNGNQNTNYNQNIALGPIPAVGLNSQYVFGRIDSQMYDDANDYARLTVADETINPSGYTWYRSIIAFNNTPYLAAFVRNYIKIDACCNTDCVSTAYLHDKNGDNVSEVTTFSGEKRIYYPAGYESVYRCENPVDFHLFDVGNAFLRANVKHPYDSFGVWNYAPYTEGEWTYWHITLTINHVDSYIVSFKPAQNNNLYLNSSETIKPYLFDTTTDSKPATSIYATTDSDGTLNIRVPINSSLCNDGTYPQTSYKYNDSTGGYVGVYTIHVKDTWYAVAYHFTETVPNLSCAVHTATYPISITSNLDITTTFSGGYTNVTFGAVDHATETDLSSSGYVHRVAKGSTVTAVYDTNNYSWITYSIGGVEKIKYTCNDGYLISATGLGTGLSKSMTITSDTTINPTIISVDDKVVLTFNPVVISDSVGNTFAYSPTRTGSGWTGSDQSGYSISLLPGATLKYSDKSGGFGSNGGTGYKFSISDSAGSYSIEYVAKSTNNYKFTGFECGAGLTQLGLDAIYNRYRITSTSSVTIMAEYTTLTTVNFDVVDVAYLYAPVSTPVYVDNYATADFGTNYMNSTGAEFEHFLDYESSTYTVNIASDNVTESKPKIERVISEENGIYTITYVVSYKLNYVSKKAEVAQYLAESNVMRLVNDGYTDGSAITSDLTIKPQMSYPAIIFEQPIDTVKASMFKNNYVQSSASQYILGSNLVITNNLQKEVTYTYYGDIDVEIHPQNIIYTFDVYTTTKTLSAGNVNTSNETNVEKIEYKINDEYKSSAWLQPAYSDITISIDATNISFSKDLIIAPNVRTDCKVEFTAVLSGTININPQLYKNNAIVTSVNNNDSFISFDGNGKITIKLSYADKISIRYDKEVDLENDKNLYLFTFSINGNNYEISFDLIDNASYKLVNDVFAYGESKTIDQDIKVQCEAELKDYEINK